MDPIRKDPTAPLHVVPDEVGGWSVRREGDAEPLSAHDSETAAEGAAVEKANATGTDEVIVHDRYNRVQPRQALKPQLTIRRRVAPLDCTGTTE